MARVFVSYSRKNAEFVLQMVAHLRAYHIPVWLDQFDLPPGVRWDVAIDAALKSCSVVLAILSPAAVISSNVQDEIGTAVDAGKTIIPVEIEACEAPFRIRQLQRISFVKQSYEAAFSQLLTALLGKAAQHALLAPVEGSYVLVVNKQDGDAEIKRKLGDSNPTLVFQEDSRLAHVPVMQISLTVGRGAECDIVVKNKGVSREHLLITAEGTRYVIEDLGSTNGTAVNGATLKQKYPLRPGDRIEIGSAVQMDFHPVFTPASIQAYRDQVDPGTGLINRTTLPLLEEDDEGGPTVPNRARVGEVVEIHRATKTVYVRGRKLAPSLTNVQFAFLLLLFEAGGEVCSRNTIARTVWPDTEMDMVSNEIIQTVASRINARLAEADPGWEYIVSAGGYCYRFNNRSPK